jgi:hypothetical protein
MPRTSLLARLEIDLSLSKLKAIGGLIDDDEGRPFEEHLQLYLDVLTRSIRALPQEEQMLVQTEVNHALLGILAWYHANVSRELQPNTAKTIDVSSILDHLPMKNR